MHVFHVEDNVLNATTQVHALNAKMDIIKITPIYANDAAIIALNAHQKTNAIFVSMNIIPTEVYANNAPKFVQNAEVQQHKIVLTAIQDTSSLNPTIIASNVMNHA